MKLHIKREQGSEPKTDQGLLRGWKGGFFFTHIQLELDEDEMALVTKYKLEKNVIAVTRHTRSESRKWVIYESPMTVEEFINGAGCLEDDIELVLEFEHKVKDGCQDIKDRFTVMQNFGGEETIEY